jgi:integrase
MQGDANVDHDNLQPRRVVVWVSDRAARKFLQLHWQCPQTGRRMTRSTGTADAAQAEAQRADLEYALNHGLYGVDSRLTWEEFRRLFEARHVAPLRAKTRRKYETVLDLFEKVAAPRLLRQVNEQVVGRFEEGMRQRRYRGRLSLAPWTRRNYLVGLKTALTWAKGQRLIREVPNFPVVKVPKFRPQPVPAESFERLLEKAETPGWRALLLCAWWAGLRLQEAYELRRSASDEFPWYDQAGGRIVLPAKFAKSDEDQWVPCHPVLAEALDALPDAGDRFFLFPSRKGGVLQAASVSHVVSAMAKKAGVRLSMHRLRKGFGCRVAKQLGKGNAPVLHRLMRHSSMQLTMDFYASVDDALADALRGLE